MADVKTVVSQAMSPDDRLRHIITQALLDPNRGVPFLVGPTQWGKTKWVEDYYTKPKKEGGYWGIEAKNIVRINPQNDLPEDMAGWPYRDAANYLRFTQPANFRPELVDPKNYDDKGNPIMPWGIFVDELDKAQESVLSTLLTFINPDERRLRNTYISRKVPIICAMNEPEHRAMPEPLLARALFLRFPPAGFRVATREHLRPIESIAKDMFGDDPVVRFPERPRSPGSLHKLVYWTSVPEFWADEAYRVDVVGGLFGDKDRAIVQQKLMERAPNPTKEWAEMARPQDVASHIIDVITAADYQTRIEILTVLSNKANNDATGELPRVIAALFETPQALHAIGRPDMIDAGRKALLDKLGGDYTKLLKTQSRVAAGKKK